MDKPAMNKGKPLFSLRFVQLNGHIEMYILSKAWLNL